jgi:hypothetical protein
MKLDAIVHFPKAIHEEVEEILASISASPDDKTDIRELLPGKNSLLYLNLEL